VLKEQFARIFATILLICIPSKIKGWGVLAVLGHLIVVVTLKAFEDEFSSYDQNLQ